MSTHVVYGAISGAVEGMPTFVGKTISGGEAMAESGTSAQSSSAITAHSDYTRATYAWRIAAIGAPVYVAVGDNPTVTVANGVYLGVGAVEWIVGTIGDKVAIKTI